MSNQTKDWPHAPVHQLSNDGVFMVTGATLYKQRLFSGRDRLDILEGSLLSLSKEYLWQLEAWSAFANHYTSSPEVTATQRTLGCFSITCMVKLRAN